MERYEHGGNIYAHPGCVDFSANLNPLGMPQAAREALASCASACAAYPDPRCTELAEALAAYERVPHEWVLPCAGATDAFARICLALRPAHALVCAPSYSGYEQALEVVGAQVLRHALQPEKDFEVTARLAQSLSSPVEVAFVANPNNPTGRCVKRDVLEACLERAAEQDIVMVLDECFVDLTLSPGSNDLLGHYPNLVIVKALTKTFCLAGLRVGYLMCANDELLAQLRQVGQPWAVSVPAQLASVAALREKGYVSCSRTYVARERARLVRALKNCGLRVIPSDANYVLFEGTRDMYEEFLHHGILVRPCDNYQGLAGNWLRVAVRTSAENDRLIRALGHITARDAGSNRCAGAVQERS